MGFWNPLISWTWALVLFPWTIRYRRREVAAIREKGAGCAADGVFRIHLSSAVDWLGGFAACGAYVERLGGRRSSVTCRACKRIMRRAEHIEGGAS